MCLVGERERLGVRGVERQSKAKEGERKSWERRNSNDRQVGRGRDYRTRKKAHTWRENAYMERVNVSGQLIVFISKPQFQRVSFLSRESFKCKVSQQAVGGESL